jgi:DNA-binding Lrp family transcriptional regulator
MRLSEIGFDRIYRQDIAALSMLADYKPITSRGLAKLNGTSKRAACYTLAKLERMGLVEGVGPKNSPFRIYVIPGLRMREARGVFMQIVASLKRIAGACWARVPAFVRSLIIKLQQIIRAPRRARARLENGPTPNPGMAGLGAAVCKPKGGRGI